ncbi:MAG: F0F1 ATP synthase subunit B [Candidatus Moraniibacteriota bacterium]|nr:MAG: F0F1 ATP synthase subunit B [Candidatus Moranbacteria bacterium]
MEVLAKLGVDWKLLIAQAINFVVLLFVLKRYAYGPILRALEARTKKIEQGLKDAAASEEILASTVEEEKRIMAAAREEARDILVRAETSAKERDGKMLLETKAKIDKMITDADAHLAEEKARLVREAKAELSGLIVTATGRVLGRAVDVPVDAKLVAEALEKAN